MKRFIFKVEEKRSLEISVLGATEQEGRENIIKGNIEREDEITSDMDIVNAVVTSEEEI